MQGILDYYKSGLKGELRLKSIFFASDLCSLEFYFIYLIPYIFGYILVFSLLFFHAENIGIGMRVFIGLACMALLLQYCWMIKALFGAANHYKTPIRIMIKTLAVLLPVISFVLFVFIIVFQIINGLLSAIFH